MTSMYNLDYIDPPMLEKTVQASETQRLMVKTIGCMKIDNGIILPFRHLDNVITGNDIGGGIISAVGKHISVLDIGEQEYPINEQEVIENSYDAIYLGLFHPKWGHCLTDNLKKIWFLFSSEYEKIKHNDIKFIYTAFDGFQLNGNFLELLSLLGVEVEKLILVEKVSRYKKIYIPDDCFIFDNYKRFYTNEYCDLLNRIPVYQSNKIFTKIYFSRKSFDTVDFGEEDIEGFFSKNGFKVIYPEKLSLVEQLKLLQHCETFAATEGSISHNAIFCRENTNLVVIRKTDCVNEYQMCVNSLRNLNVTYIDAHLSVFNHMEVYSNEPWGGPFFMYVNENLQRYAKSKSYLNTFSLDKFFAYTKESLLMDMYEKRNIDVYYWKKLRTEILNVSRHKYRKFANKLFPNFFPYKGNW